MTKKKAKRVPEEHKPAFLLEYCEQLNTELAELGEVVNELKDRIAVLEARPVGYVILNEPLQSPPFSPQPVSPMWPPVTTCETGQATNADLPQVQAYNGDVKQ